jgi:ribose 5-phosphate isomerase A
MSDPISRRLFGGANPGMPYAAADATKPTDRPVEHDALAQAAIAPIQSGMVVGLGTGRTASRAIRALARRVQLEHLEITCVGTSLASEELAREIGLRMANFNETAEIDYLFDGADECDNQLRMMKGAHGAITRQRLVAHAAKRCVYMTHEDKVVEQLGSRGLLSVVIIPFGVASIRDRLRNLGLSGVVRKNMDNEAVITDGGGMVLDMRITGRNVEQLALDLDHVPGVVDHGLFLTEADEVLVEDRGGLVRQMAPAV